MIPTSIPIPLPGGLGAPLPRFQRARQRFNSDAVRDVAAAVAAEFAKFQHMDLSGKSIALAIGSRGIRSQPPVVKAVIGVLKAAGAQPFIVPAMGSHGGGAAEGQAKILEGYGLGAEDLGVPLKSSMEVVPLGSVPDGDLPPIEVFCDKLAYEADYIVPINRVKPHTNFRGAHESGLSKMVTIGLGKHVGAVAMHERGMARFGPLLPKTAALAIEKTNILFGVAIVENGYEKLHTVELAPPATIVARDAALLELAKSLIPRLLLPEVDILVVDEIGKNISGGGADPNVTGRANSQTRDFGGPSIHRIVLRALTPETAGNATGMGTADIVTQRLVRQIDWSKTYVNVVTAGAPIGAVLPLVADTDRDAMHIAMRSVPMATAERVRAIRIENTLDLGEIWISTALAAEAEAHAAMEIVSDPFEMAFDEAGGMAAF